MERLRKLGKKRLVIIGIAAGTVLLAAVLMLFARGGEDLRDQAVSGTVITYRDSGFSPQVLKVPSGTTVTVENESSRDVQISSDPYPTQTSNPEISGDVLSPDGRQMLLLTSKGTWGYHNSLNPDETGTVIVE